jgi:hypothetical protein
MKKLIFLLAVLPFFGCIAYDPPAKQISFSNKSKMNVLVFITYSDTISIEYIKELYEVSAIEKVNRVIHEDYYVQAYNKEDIVLLYWKMGNNYDNKIRFFVISEKSIDENDWVDIVENQLYVKKMIYTTKQLKKNNWEVTFNMTNQ